MIARQAVVDEARKWLGAPFVHQGRVPQGIDCLGIVGRVGIALGVETSAQWEADQEVSDYGLAVHRPDVLVRKCDQYLDRIALAAAGLGDILLMRFNVFPQHFAIVSRLSPMYVIHAYSSPSVNRVTENGVHVAGAKLYRAYRFRGVEA